MQVVDARQHGREHLATALQVVQIGAREAARHRAIGRRRAPTGVAGAGTSSVWVTFGNVV